MLAMKIENIGFFLATCKTRLNLPPALLFQPTDIHDDSNNLNSMSKVLNVLSFLKGDGEGGMIAGLEDDDDEDEAETAAPPKQAEEVDADIEPEPEPTHTTEVPKSAGGNPAKSEPAVTKPVAPVELSTADFVEMQGEVLKVINDAINQELSIESKRKLVKLLQQQLSSFEEKLMTSPDDQLSSLLHNVAPEESQKANNRQSIVEALNLYSRIQ